MKKKRVLSFLLVFLMVLGVVGCGGQGTQEETLKVTAGTPTYEDDKQIEIGAWGSSV